MSNVAIIPARGGSKRIPRKNIKDFFGKPIISYSIEAAVSSGLFDEVMVSTEDAEIAEVAEKYGAKVPFMRSQKNADDFSTTVDVLLEVLEKYNRRGVSFNNLCCIYPTAPFVSALKLKNSYNLMIQKKANGVIPVVLFSYPIQRSFRINKYDKLEYIFPENMNQRSQDLEPAYHDIGQFYWIKIRELLAQKTLVTNNILPFIVSELEVQDIDNETDWKIAEKKFLNFIK